MQLMDRYLAAPFVECGETDNISERNDPNYSEEVEASIEASIMFVTANSELRTCGWNNG